MDELRKLPDFLRVADAADMLSQCEEELLGMNRAQMYFKVNGCRTPGAHAHFHQCTARTHTPFFTTKGHQENNDFCSVNINIGPGDCLWYGVDAAHAREMDALCLRCALPTFLVSRPPSLSSSSFSSWAGPPSLFDSLPSLSLSFDATRNGIDFVKGSWWPSEADLMARQLPVYRFRQKPGQVVYVNAGTIHWVKALGATNNVAWNVGPCSPRQYDMAVDRYILNTRIGMSD